MWKLYSFFLSTKVLSFFKSKNLHENVKVLPAEWTYMLAPLWSKWCSASGGRHLPHGTSHTSGRLAAGELQLTLSLFSHCKISGPIGSPMGQQAGSGLPGQWLSTTAIIYCWHRDGLFGVSRSCLPDQETNQTTAFVLLDHSAVFTTRNWWHNSRSCRQVDKVKICPFRTTKRVISNHNSA